MRLRPTIAIRHGAHYMGGPLIHRYYVYGIRVPRSVFAFVANRIRPR